MPPSGFTLFRGDRTMSALVDFTTHKWVLIETIIVVALDFRISQMKLPNREGLPLCAGHRKEGAEDQKKFHEWCLLRWMMIVQC